MSNVKLPMNFAGGFDRQRGGTDGGVKGKRGRARHRTCFKRAAVRQVLVGERRMRQLIPGESAIVDRMAFYEDSNSHPTWGYVSLRNKGEFWWAAQTCRLTIGL